MKVEFLRNPDAAESVQPETFERAKLVVAWAVASVVVTIFIFSRKPARGRVASAKTS
jgi:hypothetical protein